MITPKINARLLNILSIASYSFTGNNNAIKVKSLVQIKPSLTLATNAFQYNRPIAVYYQSPNYYTTTSLSMRGGKKGNGNSNSMGRTISKQNLPTKICVTCNRPFTWRKKWERVWDEVTTCSKSCNAKRRSSAKHKSNCNDNDVSLTLREFSTSMGHQVSSSMIEYNSGSNNSSVESIVSIQDDHAISLLSSSCEQKNIKAMSRKEHKEAIKKLKAERRLKRTGKANPIITRKACHLCSQEVDLLIRCTIDESMRYYMVCSRCWKDVSGGVVDGDESHPYYKYGGLWKNRYASYLKTKVGTHLDDKFASIHISENCESEIS